MTQSDNISAELRELSPLLAGISKLNVYNVPDGYFETLKIDLLVAVSGATDMQFAAASSVPENYFTNLSLILLDKVRKNEVLKETNEISTFVAEIGNNNVFAAPTGYFKTLPASAINRINADPEDLGFEGTLAGISNHNTYSVPTGYFNNLATEILARLATELTQDVKSETQSVSTLIAGIGTKNIYSVPREYFEKLAGDVVKKAAKPQGKVVSIRSRFNTFKYAAAAVVTGIIGLSIFFMLNKNEPAKNLPATATMVAAEKIIKTNTFDTEMNSVSDEAIVNFLESKGENVEAALVASLADDKNLPDATDYLVDDNALDEILKTVELSN